MFSGFPPSSNLAVAAIPGQTLVSTSSLPWATPAHLTDLPIPAPISLDYSLFWSGPCSPASVCVFRLSSPPETPFPLSVSVMGFHPPPRLDSNLFLLQMPPKVETSSLAFVSLNEIYSYFYYSTFQSLSHLSPICLPCGILRLQTLSNSSP